MNQNIRINGVGGDPADEDESTSPIEFVVHEITIIGNRPTATSTNSNSIDTVDQRMLLMDKGNGLNAIMEKLQMSTDEQTFPEVPSDDENSTARSSKSSSRFSMQSTQSESNQNMVNENQWTTKLPKPISIESSFDSENELESSDGDGKAMEIEIGATVTVELSIDDADSESDIENKKSEWNIEGNSMEDTMQKSVSNEIEIEKQLNEKSPTDEFDERQFSIANIQNEEENECTTPTNSPIHENDFEKSTTKNQHDDVGRDDADALMDLLLSSLLEDCAEIEKSENDVAQGEAVSSQIERECLESALQSILEDEEICVDDLETPIPESWSTDQSFTMLDTDSGREKLN